MSKVYVFLADGFEEIEGLTVVDLLRRAGEEVETVSIMGRKMIEGSHKIKVEADASLKKQILQRVKCWFCREECLEPDILVHTNR